LSERKVKITIVDDTASPRTCTGNCGTDWSRAESTNAAREQISGRFGRLAELEYVDLHRVGNKAATAKLRATVTGMPFPVLLADGRPRIAGEFDLRQIMDVIEVDLEADL
jgi:hypothetical protein